MPIKNYHKTEQPRERLVKYGPGKLLTSELLAIILRTGPKDSNVLKVAESALRTYHGNKLANASFEELKRLRALAQSKRGS